MTNQTDSKNKSSKELGFLICLFLKTENESTQTEKYCFINKTYKEASKTMQLIPTCVGWKWLPHSLFTETPEEIFELTRENACYRLTPATQNE